LLRSTTTTTTTIFSICADFTYLKGPDDSVIATEYNEDDKAIAITDPGGGQWM
jgi:hypothetical protein